MTNQNLHIIMMLHIMSQFEELSALVPTPPRHPPLRFQHYFPSPQLASPYQALLSFICYPSQSFLGPSLPVPLVSPPWMDIVSGFTATPFSVAVLVD